MTKRITTMIANAGSPLVSRKAEDETRIAVYVQQDAGQLAIGLTVNANGAITLEAENTAVAGSPTRLYQRCIIADRDELRGLTETPYGRKLEGPHTPAHDVTNDRPGSVTLSAEDAATLRAALAHLYNNDRKAHQRVTYAMLALEDASPALAAFVPRRCMCGATVPTDQEWCDECAKDRAR